MRLVEGCVHPVQGSVATAVASGLRRHGQEGSGAVVVEPALAGGILVIDEHGLFAEGLVVALRLHGFRAAATSDLSPEVLADVARRVRPAVALLDAGRGAETLTRRLISGFVADGVPVVSLSEESDPAVLGGYLQAGAVAVWSKNATLASLTRALEGVLRGGPVMSTAEHQRLVDAFELAVAEREDKAGRLQRLSRREQEVLRDLMHGLTVSDIARESFVSMRTVRSQVQSILTKLDVNSQLQAVLLAVGAGWHAHSAHQVP